MGAWALESSRQHSYKDLSEMMFESLKHPDTLIPSKNWIAAQRALHVQLWNSMSYFFTAIEQHIGPGGVFEAPTRWTKRSTLVSALNGNVIDSTSTLTDAQALPEIEEDDIVSEKGKKKKPQRYALVDGDRAYNWLLGLELRERDKRERRQKGKGKATTKSPDTLEEDGLSLLFFKPKTTSNPVNLAEYARILDYLSDSLPSKLLFASADTELLTTLLKDAKSQSDSTLQVSHPSAPIKLIIRTPVPWSDFAGNGPQDNVNVWHPAAILEHAAISLYRKDFIAGPVRGFIRQDIERCLHKYMEGEEPVFDWPDSLRNTAKLSQYENFDSPLALMDLEVARYSQSARQELLRVITAVQSSFVTTNPPTHKTLTTTVPPLSTISHDMSNALNTLYTVSPV